MSRRKRILWKMEIKPLVYLIDDVGFSNVYLLAGEELILIDTGPGDVEPIFDFIASLGRKPSELSYIFITHGHVDHIGGLWKVRAKTRARVIAYEGETACDLGLVRDTTFSYMGGLRIYHTPGHTFGSTSLFLEEKGVLFVGDAINGRESKTWSNLLRDNQDYWSKLGKKLPLYRIKVCCFGHGPPCYSYG